jgi:DNA-binding CsgD family transcriptional regulator
VHLGEAAISRSEFYQDYLRPLGLGCVAAPRLSAGAHLEAYVSLQRALDQQPFEPRELAALAPILAHLRRAVRLRNRVEELSARAAFGSRLLDAVRVPAFVADAKGRVRAFNPRAECRLDRGDREVIVRAGRLQMPAAAQRLAHALSRACGHQGPAVADAFQLWRGQGLAPLQVVVTPLPVGMDPARHAPQPLALVLLQDPAEPLEACEGVLQSLYGMTPAEARVAAAIVRGATPAAAAQALGVRLPTVRTQLKAVFLKAGVDGQGELVRRLAPLLVVGQ